jgi:hypothetical protein
MPRTVVVTGMGRSGTSLAASLLQRAGLHIGDRLIDAGGSNPHGYFEDADFVEFHEHALRSAGSANLLDNGFTFRPTVEDREWADRIVAQRTGRELWGFKDPRAALFLDFWDERLDNAVYLFVFRHPLDVLVSLLRYGELRAIGLAEPIRAWEGRYTRILDFRARHPERCAIAHAYGLADPDGLDHVLRRKLGVDLSITPAVVAGLYRPSVLHSGDRWAQDAFGLIAPTAAEIYTRLTAAADIAPPEQVAPEEPRSIASFRRATAELLPELGDRRRGLLLSLLELTAPDVTEGGVRRQLEWILELEQANEWLEAQRLTWQRTAEDRLADAQLRPWARIRRLAMNRRERPSLDS